MTLLFEHVLLLLLLCLYYCFFPNMLPLFCFYTLLVYFMSLFRFWCHDTERHINSGNNNTPWSRELAIIVVDAVVWHLVYLDMIVPTSYTLELLCVCVSMYTIEAVHQFFSLSFSLFTISQQSLCVLFNAPNLCVCDIYYCCFELLLSFCYCCWS